QPDVGEARHIVRRVHAALILGQSDERSIPSLRPRASRSVQRNPSVIAELGTRKTVRPILIQAVRPDAAQVHLRKQRTRRAREQQDSRNSHEYSTPRLQTEPLHSVACSAGWQPAADCQSAKFQESRKPPIHRTPGATSTITA